MAVHWSTLAWVKARLKLITHAGLQSRVPCDVRGLCRGTAISNISRHVHSGGTTREAIAVLKSRLQRGAATPTQTYVKVLQMCSKQKDLSAAKQVHDCLIKSGIRKNPSVANALVNAYIKCGGLLNARRVFDELDKKNVVTWTMMIAGYAKNDYAESAVVLFNRMRQVGVQPDEITYLSILKACASPSALKWGKELHACIMHAGLESNVRVGTALLQMYAKCGCMAKARMKTRDIFTWNIMIGAYAESGRGVEAYRLFLQMTREGFDPDAITYLSILNAAASAGALEWVREVHGLARKAGLESDLRVSNALVHMYAKCGCITEARQVFEKLTNRDLITWNAMLSAYAGSGSLDDARLMFDRMEQRDVITWNIMIGAYAERGLGVEAYRLFLQMRRKGFEPDAITYMSILNAAAIAGPLEWVKEVHGCARKAGLVSDLRVGNALVHMYARTGSIEDARLVFDGMEKRDVITWNAMIGGLAQHGCGHEALELFKKMNAVPLKPDGASFVAMLSACCHSGLLDDGRGLFLAMTRDYGIEPTVVHCNCIVDLLGRSGHLEEAKLFISEMPVEPDGVTWKALLGACRTYRNVELGELAAKELLNLEPNYSPAYVLLSNIYAAAGKWEKKSLVRSMMQERGVRKEPGRSWIEVDNKIHEFFVGDTSHPEANAISAELKNLTEKLKADGYVPDTQIVLENDNEEAQTQPRFRCLLDQAVALFGTGKFTDLRNEALNASSRFLIRLGERFCINVLIVFGILEARLLFCLGFRLLERGQTSC